jgi:cytochrome P450
MSASTSLPPGLGSLPAVQLVRWITAPFELLDECSRRFGDAFTLRVPGPASPFVVVSSPEAIKDVFALDGDRAHAGKANVVLKPLLGPHSILLLDGPDHARQRKMMLPAFHGDRLAAYRETMTEIAHDAIDRLPVGVPFPIVRVMQSITLQIIVRTVFGVQDGRELPELTDALSRSIDAAARPYLLLPPMQRDLGPLSPWGRFLRHGARASAMLRSAIRRGRVDVDPHRTDVLALLLAARDENGQAMGEDEIHDELVTMLVAGHETTATALGWALRWIWADAQLTRSLCDEVASARDDLGAIAKLDLLDRCVREALRLQPVLPLVGRVLQRPTRIGGMELDAGTSVACAIYLVHRRPSLYPEPDRFAPERFITFKPTPWEWLPFGGGLRRCLGAAFALLEMKMVLAALLPRVVARVARPRVAPVRRGITLTPEGGLPVVVSARRSRQGRAGPRWRVPSDLSRSFDT